MKKLSKLSSTLLLLPVFPTNLINSLSNNSFNNISNINVDSQNLKNNAWHFKPAFSGFFANRSVKQIVTGATDSTLNQKIYATNNGLFVQKSEDTAPQLITTTADGNDVSHFSFLSIYPSSNKSVDSFYVNATSDEYDFSKNVCYLISFTDPHDFTSAVLTKLPSFTPQSSPSTPINPNQLIVVGSLVFGLYLQSNEKLGLVAKNLTNSNCDTISSFNTLGLELTNVKYLKISIDANNSRIFISTYSYLIFIYNVQVDFSQIFLTVFTFEDAQTRKYVSLTNLSYIFFDPLNKDIYLSSDKGIYGISNQKLKTAEKQRANFLLTNENHINIEAGVNINKISQDAEGEVWALSNQGLYLAEPSDSLQDASFKKVSAGIPSNCQVYDMSFSITSNEEMKNFIATNNGLFIGSDNGIDPDPTPTPSTHHHLSPAAIAGIVIGAVALVGISIGAGYYFIRKNK